MSGTGPLRTISRSWVGECFLSALCRSAWKGGSGPPVSALEFHHLCARLRRVDQKLQEMSHIFQGSGLPPADQTEVKLSELLQAVAFLLSKYPTLNSSSVQEAMSNVIYTVQDVTTQNVSSERPKRYSEIFRGLDALEMSLGNETVDMFMSDAGFPKSDSQQDEEEEPLISTPLEISRTSNDRDGTASSTEEADEILIRSEGGVESALNYAKRWCKYVREVLGYMERRLIYESEFAKNSMKLSESARNTFSQQHCMPLQDVYLLLMDHEIHTGTSALETVAQLQMKKYYQPLSAKKTEIEKWRKEFREQWQREQKRMQDSLSSLRKARIQYIQRCDDLEKAKQLSAKIEEEQSTGSHPGSASKQLERRKRSREDAQIKAQEAEATYRCCVFEANARSQQQEKVRERIISHVRKLVHQGDQVLKEVTMNLLRMKQNQYESIPCGYKNLATTCDPYESGDRYLQFILTLPRQHTQPENFVFQEYIPAGQRSPSTSRRKDAVQLVRVSSSLSDLSSKIEEVTVKISPGERSSWGNKIPSSDSESLGANSEPRSLESPTNSPGNFTRRVPKASSTGTMSSDDLDDRDSGQAEDVDSTDTTSENSLQLQNYDRSLAAQSHRLRRIRVPTKCRECENYMVSGVECEECYLTCHKKCLETLLIKCGHQKLPSKVPLIGLDFCHFPRYFPEEVPFIIVKCTSEIELRALGQQGLYRISGAQARVEKLLQAFENGRDLVDLSGHSPHDITSCLKQFLKKLPDSVVPHKFYGEFITFSRDYQEDKKDNGSHQDSVQHMKNILCRLPASNYNTLRHLTAHLYRVSERYEENKMNPNNLGIIFGPTLIRPSSGLDMSMTCLIDSGYQAQAVEFLINKYEKIFGMDELPLAGRQHLGDEQMEAEIKKDKGSSEEGQLYAMSSELDYENDGVPQEDEEDLEMESVSYSRDHFSRLPVKVLRAEQNKNRGSGGDDEVGDKDGVRRSL